MRVITTINSAFGRYPVPSDTVTERNVPVPANCDEVIQITIDNASDVLCALGEYSKELMDGSVTDPETGDKVCFCLEYNRGISVLLKFRYRQP